MNFSNCISGCFIILALYRVIWCNIYSDILSSYSAISLMLTKATLAQKLDYLEDEIKSQLQSLTNVFTRTNIQYIDKMLGTVIILKVVCNINISFLNP